MTRSALLAAFLGLGLLVSSSPAQSIPSGTRRSPEMLQAFRSVVADALKSTVRVFSNGEPVALGTVVSAEGLLITKYSELKGKVTCALPDGQKVDAEILGAEPKHDLALLKISAKGLKPVNWLMSTKAEAGDWLASVGLNEDPLAVGVVGVPTRRPKARDYPMNPPPPDSGYLGVFLKDGEGPATIGDLEKDGPAAKAGLKKDDVILRVDGRRIESSDKLIEAVQKYKAGERVTLLVRRLSGGKKESEMEIELGKRKAAPGGFDRGDFQNKMGSKLSVRRQGFPVILQHDMVVEPRDCGGPIVNLDGKVVGVNIARAGRTESYAIPIEVVIELLPELRSGKLTVKLDETSAEEERFKRIRKLTKDLEDLKVAEGVLVKRLDRLKLIDDDPDELAKVEKQLEEKRSQMRTTKDELEKARNK